MAELHFTGDPAALFDAIAELGELLNARPAWHRQAACRGQMSTMFPVKGQPAAPAKRLCAACPVREPCAAFALEHDVEGGIWAGASPKERQAARRAAA